MRGNLKLSATAFGLAMICASVWWGAFATMTMLHSDAKFEHALSVTLDKPAVRAQFAGWLTAAIKHGGTLAGKDLSGNPLINELERAVASKENLAPMADAITTVALRARDAAVVQLDAKLSPKQPVLLELGPVFDAAKIKVDKKAAKAMGLALNKQTLTTQLLAPDQLEALQERYTWTKRANTWGGWLALALLVVAVVTSAKPLRTLAVACGVLVLAAILAPLVLTQLATWLGSNELGALLEPVVISVAQAIGPYTLPVVIVGVVLAAGFTVAQVLVSRRSR
jgi:hypothetical protein